MSPQIDSKTCTTCDSTLSGTVRVLFLLCSRKDMRDRLVVILFKDGSKEEGQWHGGVPGTAALPDGYS